MHTARLSPAEMLTSVALVSVDGYANEWSGLFWKLLSNSAVVLVESAQCWCARARADRMKR
eukprot:6204758-Pleurochrysis_carterae.AAC.3